MTHDKGKTSAQQMHNKANTKQGKGQDKDKISNKYKIGNHSLAFTLLCTLILCKQLEPKSNNSCGNDCHSHDLKN